MKPIGLCWSVPSPATREISMLARWSFAIILSAFVETHVLLLLTIATYRCSVVWEHVDVAIQIFKTQQFYSEYSALLERSVVQGSDRLSQHVTPWGQVVLRIDILAYSEESPYRVVQDFIRCRKQLLPVSSIHETSESGHTLLVSFFDTVFATKSSLVSARMADPSGPLSSLLVTTSLKVASFTFHVSAIA